jgi:hypothetical protein
MRVNVTTKKVVEGVNLQLNEKEAETLKLVANLRVRIAETIYHATGNQDAAADVVDMLYSVWHGLHTQDIHAGVHVRK